MRKRGGNEPQFSIIPDAKILESSKYCDNREALACADSSASLKKLYLPTLANFDVLEHEYAHFQGKGEILARLAEGRFQGKSKEDALREVGESAAYTRRAFLHSFIEAFDGKLYIAKGSKPTFTPEADAWLDNGPVWKTFTPNPNQLKKATLNCSKGRAKKYMTRKCTKKSEAS